MDKNSTDEFIPKSFTPHGRAKLTISADGVHIYEATGPFNNEFIDAVAGLHTNQELNKIKIQQSKWSEIIIFKENALASPETLDLYSKMLSDLKRNNLLASAVAIVIEEDVSGHRVMEKLYKKIFTNLGVIASTFSDANEARDWIKNLNS